jgi:hypothetical protein
LWRIFETIIIKILIAAQQHLVFIGPKIGEEKTGFLGFGSPNK